MAGGVFNYEAVITVLILTGLLCLGSWLYGRSMEKTSSYQSMSRFSFLVFSVVQWVRRNVSQIIGSMNPFAAVVAMSLLSCFWFSNVLCILGFTAPTNSIVIPFGFSAFVFVVTIFFGIYYRGRKFFSDYIVRIGFGKRKWFKIVDPLKILSELSKILSLGCRLWGNTLAGSLILHIIYSLVSSSGTSGTIEYLGPILIPFFVFPVHVYFDIFGPGVQASIFMLLTLVYWSLARHGEGAHEKQDNVAKYENIG